MLLTTCLSGLQSVTITADDNRGLYKTFINDLDLNIHNVLLKFADDTKICSRICNSNDVQKLQEDLNTLQADEI